jgi:hypothetical protein
MQQRPVDNRPPSVVASGSMAPVGLEVMAEHDSAEEALGEPGRDRAQQTGSIRIPLRRRRLGGIVIGTLAGCALILVAAVIARVSHASSEPAATAAPPNDLATATTARPSPPPAVALGGAPPVPLPVAPASGTLRLERPAVPGRVWVDGKKQMSLSAVVACGTHQVKIGARGHAHSVDVPCGGELVVAK